jgi:hypothetical protein
VQTGVSSEFRPRLRLRNPADPNTLSGTPILAVSFASAEEFLLAYEDAGPAGELAILTRATPTERELVLEVSWPGLPNHVFLRAQVSVRQLGLLARIHGDDAPARNFLLQLARGERRDLFVRSQERYCVRLPLTWRPFGDLDPHAGIVEDLSTGGLLVSTVDGQPEPGARVSLRLEASGQDLIVTGTVRHTRRRSTDLSFGVQFEHRSSAEQRRLRGMVRMFAERGVVLLKDPRHSRS